MVKGQGRSACGKFVGGTSRAPVAEFVSNNLTPDRADASPVSIDASSALDATELWRVSAGIASVAVVDTSEGRDRFAANEVRWPTERGYIESSSLILPPSCHAAAAPV